MAKYSISATQLYKYFSVRCGWLCGVSGMRSAVMIDCHVIKKLTCYRFISPSSVAGWVAESSRQTTPVKMLCIIISVGIWIKIIIIVIIFIYFMDETLGIAVVVVPFASWPSFEFIPRNRPLRWSDMGDSIRRIVCMAWPERVFMVNQNNPVTRKS